MVAGAMIATLASVALLGTVAWAADGGVGTAAPAGDRTAAGDADPDAPTVAARVDKATAHVGDAIAVTVTAVARKGVPVNLPNVLDLGAFSLLERAESEADLGDGRVRREFILKVAAYEPGRQVTLLASEARYWLRFNKALEHHADFVWTTFTLTAKE